MNNRPRLKIELQPLDRVLEIVAILGLLICIGLPMYYFTDLPDNIPSHFGANGEPDKYSDKGIIWMLPGIAIFLYIGMTWVNKFPHTFNFPQKVTTDNAPNLYLQATRMLRAVKAIVTIVFSYLCFASIKTALGHQSGLGVWFAPIFLISIFGVVIYFYSKSMSQNKSEADD